MARSVKANGGAIPEGTRLMALEQVYKKIKPEMETEARRDYLELEGLVRGAVTARPSATSSCSAAGVVSAKIRRDP